MSRYYYWVAVSRANSSGVGDTGEIEAESAQEAADDRAAKLRRNRECHGQVVRTQSDDLSETGEAVV